VTRLRLAIEADIPTLLDMGAEMFAGSSFAPMEYSREKAAATMLHGIKTAFLAVSLNDAGDITGAIQGDVIEPWYSTDRMGIEYFVYVRPEYRGTRAAWMLIKAWTLWCIDSGAKQVRPATAATSEAADRMYAGLGFKRAGSLFVMDVNQKEKP
jgi:GNAT superfamily N-acetyltransferase